MLVEESPVGRAGGARAIFPAMVRSRLGRARRGYCVALRAIACLLLAIIAADVGAGTVCDSLGFGPASAATVRGPDSSGANEPCADVCVPDCFCCSRSLPAGPLVLPPEPQRFTSVDAPAAEDWPEGVRPVLDHPPLARG